MSRLTTLVGLIACMLIGVYVRGPDNSSRRYCDAGIDIGSRFISDTGPYTHI